MISINLRSLILYRAVRSESRPSLWRHSREQETREKEWAFFFCFYFAGTRIPITDSRELSRSKLLRRTNLPTSFVFGKQFSRLF